MRQTPFSLQVLPSLLGAPDYTDGTDCEGGKRLTAEAAEGAEDGEGRVLATMGKDSAVQPAASLYMPERWGEASLPTLSAVEVPSRPPAAGA